MKKLFMLAVSSILLAPSWVLAQATPIFPVDTVTMGQVKTDILAWAAAIIGVVLAIFAYRKVKSVVR
jgi:predicted membrane protein